MTWKISLTFPIPHSPHTTPLLVIVILLLRFHRTHRDPIQISLPRLRDPSPALLLVLLQDANLLQTLHHLPIDTPASIDMMRGAGSTILRRPMDLPQAADAHGLAQVDVPCDGRGTHIVPISR